MFCIQCGTKIEDDSSFCHHCGTKIGEVQEKKVILENNDNSQKQSVVLEENGKKSKGKLIGVLAVVITVIIFIVCFNNRTISVDLNKYVIVTTEGYNTLGEAQYQFDYDSFYDDYKDKIKMKTQNGKSTIVQDWIGDQYYAVEMLRDYFGGSLNQRSKLSNGDVITFSWSCEDDVIKNLFNCHLKYSDIEIQVTDLEEIKTFDPFEGISIGLQGDLPKVTVSVTNNSDNDAIGDIYYAPISNPILRNGGNITVQAIVRGTEEEFIEKYGMLPSPTEKQYTVEGYREYIFTQDQLTNQHVEELENLTYQELQAESWTSDETIEDVEFLGTYIISQKEPKYGDYEEYGSIYVVCKVKVNCNLDTTLGLINYPIEYYYYVNFENIVLQPDGVLTQANPFDTSFGPFDTFEVYTGYYNSRGSEYGFYYHGYETLEELEKDITTGTYNLDDYNCENNIKNN
ncbi:MAG: zinc ribbon domain-containing protein [Lachnospiraceae bacterium]|nr:zinc ribbon domain-containing protein [Lachnospiraceae bacterium]